jgi:hypothetical protein
MLFGDSAWAGAPFSAQALEVTYTSVTVNVTNVPIVYTLNDVSVTVGVSISVTNVPIAFTINDVTVTAATSIDVTGVNLNVTLNDVTVTADSSVTASNTPLTVTINTGGAAYGWSEVDSSNTTTWGKV